MLFVTVVKMMIMVVLMTMEGKVEIEWYFLVKIVAF